MGKRSLFTGFLLVVKGVVVGFGAIMPGISGGALCAAFGLYPVLLGVLAEPKATLRRHGKTLLLFGAGCVFGFFALAGLVRTLMETNAQAVTCAFVGFVLGTLPELWQDAGAQGRGKAGFGALAAGFVAMLAVLLFLRLGHTVTLRADITGFFLCGVAWGLSLILPGLSASSLLLFFGLYQPMLAGISDFAPKTLAPLALGMLLCLLILPKGVKKLYQHYFSALSHAVFGVVLASTLMIFPAQAFLGVKPFFNALGYTLGGAAVSYGLTVLCARLQK